MARRAIRTQYLDPADFLPFIEQGGTGDTRADYHLDNGGMRDVIRTPIGDFPVRTHNRQLNKDLCGFLSNTVARTVAATEGNFKAGRQWPSINDNITSQDNATVLMHTVRLANNVNLSGETSRYYGPSLQYDIMVGRWMTEKDSRTWLVKNVRSYVRGINGSYDHDYKHPLAMNVVRGILSLFHVDPSEIERVIRKNIADHGQRY